MAHQYDLLIITDATASMGSFLAALKAALPEILVLSRLSGVFTRVGVLAYRDYDHDREVVEWSGWDNAPDELLSFVDKLPLTGGWSTEEAAKTGLIRAMEKVADNDNDTLVLLYADAAPHHAHFGGKDWTAEKDAFEPGATDWVTLSFAAKTRRMRIFTLIQEGLSENDYRFFAFLAQVTGGLCITSCTNSQHIARFTIDLLLHWLGQAEPLAIPYAHSNNVKTFDVSPLAAEVRPTDEDSGNGGYLPGSSTSQKKKLTSTVLDMPRDVPRERQLDTKLVALGKRFSDPTETAYRELVYKTLREIIQRNVVTLTYNGVFGQLWRAVCREQTKEKEDIVELFGRSVGEIKDSEQRKNMTTWLEQSYDSSAEIDEVIQSASEGCQWMYLDLDAQVDLTRVELLEASRSFHRGLLKKLASIFTHAKILEPGIVLTEHQRAIPLGLPPRKIFRLLPHLVVPGTLYSSRASSVMAILALTVGVPFLEQPATAVAEFTKGTWLDLERPETLSWDCATFLLASPDPNLCLNADERATYEAMRRYRMLELNLDATLDARIPWTPDKASGVGDIKAECVHCGLSRSFTMLNDDGACGYCFNVQEGKAEQGPTVEEYPTCEANQSCWVECALRTCRAQYVVEKPQALNVRPKCWYCRNNKACPWLECTKCTNRIIVPEKFRPEGGQAFVCPACTTGTHPVIEDTETTARALMAENGLEWLGVSDKRPEATFKGFTAFKLYQAHGKEFFLDATKLPEQAIAGQTPAPVALKLTLREKSIMNAPQLLAHLDERVGRGEVARITCTLCFEDFKPERVGPACGRTGCAQRACKPCLDEWYGGNMPGTLLNTRQLGCPFCNRVPAPKIVLRTNPQVGGLKGIKEAMGDRAWFYAWCGQCSTARQCVERVCTEGGRLPDIKDFVCHQCEEDNTQAVERVERERRELEAVIAQFEDDELAADQVEAARQRLVELGGAIARKRRAGPAMRECPNTECGVMVQKEFGCDHITCQCGTHWCWVCGKMFEEYEIYGHLNDAHGGWFADPDDGDD
ncbi:hypothetical protein BKA62DRAFT_704695 [Auriculariales sp. MPI-PUGE-AT-0066]|nr:hypothetical protein BKA62DRAFT_704695 [Auriculariales sp. MPI-PUGE-AT-0066]